MEYCWMRLFIIVRWLHQFSPFHHPIQQAALIFGPGVFSGECSSTSTLTIVM